MATKYEVEVVVDADAAVRELDKLKKATDAAGKAAKDTMAPGLASASQAQAAATAAAKASAETTTTSAPTVRRDTDRRRGEAAPGASG